MRTAEAEEIWLRWMPRSKSVALLTDNDHEHRLTVEGAYCLIMGLLKVLPKKEVHSLLRRKGW